MFSVSQSLSRVSAKAPASTRKLPGKSMNTIFDYDVLSITQQVAHPKTMGVIAI